MEEEGVEKRPAVPYFRSLKKLGFAPMDSELKKCKKP
jgi:hypothetical protein